MFSFPPLYFAVLMPQLGTQSLSALAACSVRGKREGHRQHKPRAQVGVLGGHSGPCRDPQHLSLAEIPVSTCLEVLNQTQQLRALLCLLSTGSLGETCNPQH